METREVTINVTKLAITAATTVVRAFVIVMASYGLLGVLQGLRTRFTARRLDRKIAKNLANINN